MYVYDVRSFMNAYNVHMYFCTSVYCTCVHTYVMNPLCSVLEKIWIVTFSCFKEVVEDPKLEEVRILYKCA